MPFIVDLSLSSSSATLLISGRVCGQVFDSLVESTSEINGAKVENNKFCVSVHYRNVDEEVPLSLSLSLSLCLFAA